MPNTTAVDWHSYAEVYDLMADNNPAYQDLVAQFKHAIAEWCVEPRSTLADLGAGTGNFSIELAQAFPACHITHLDANAEMNRVAERKAKARRVQNLCFTTTDIATAPFRPNSLAAITTVHALYAFPHPRAVIAKMFEWLEPGGYLLACDAGRMVKVSKWAVYLLSEFCQRHGLWRTAQFYYRARVVTRQNRLIAKAQRDGRYWSHTHAEFRAAIESAGFEILTAREVYRGNSDLVVAYKPEPRFVG
jgi:ubiquinone/menaquinone biosynthesis C-methylase UbiE